MGSGAGQSGDAVRQVSASGRTSRRLCVFESPGGESSHPYLPSEHLERQEELIGPSFNAMTALCSRLRWRRGHPIAELHKL